MYLHSGEIGVCGIFPQETMKWDSKNRPIRLKSCKMLEISRKLGETHMTIKQLIADSFRIAKEKGWFDTEKSVGEDIALMHSELSEVLEDFRAGRGVTEIYYETNVISEKWIDFLRASIPSTVLDPVLSVLEYSEPKPCGIPIELADVVIRIFDFCGRHGIDLESAIKLKMEYNSTRPYRHGGKKL